MRSVIVLSLASLTNTAKNRPAGYLDDVLSVAQVDGDNVVLSPEAYDVLVQRYSRGPGTELKALLQKIGIVAAPNCSCNSRARLMDANELSEPGWCEKNIEMICDWLHEEAARRKLPFVRTAAKALVRRAIANAKNHH